MRNLLLAIIISITAFSTRAPAQENWRTGTYSTQGDTTTRTTARGEGFIETRSGSGWGETRTFSSSSGRSCISADGSVSCNQD
jgi:hypothetical protein